MGGMWHYGKRRVRLRGKKLRLTRMSQIMILGTFPALWPDRGLHWKRCYGRSLEPGIAFQPRTTVPKKEWSLEDAMRDTWPQVVKLLESEGVDVDAMLEKAGANLTWWKEHPWRPLPIPTNTRTEGK